MNRNENGMTFLETILTLVFLSFITLAANAFMLSFVNANRSLKNISEATRIGNTYLENMRMNAYDSVVDGIDTVNAKYICAWQVTENETVNMKKVELQVVWPLDKCTHSIQLATIVAE